MVEEQIQDQPSRSSLRSGADTLALRRAEIY